MVPLWIRKKVEIQSGFRSSVNHSRIGSQKHLYEKFLRLLSNHPNIHHLSRLWPTSLQLFLWKIPWTHVIFSIIITVPKLAWKLLITNLLLFFPSYRLKTELRDGSPKIIFLGNNSLDLKPGSLTQSRFALSPYYIASSQLKTVWYTSCSQRTCDLGSNNFCLSLLCINKLSIHLQFGRNWRSDWWFRVGGVLCHDALLYQMPYFPGSLFCCYYFL